MTSDYVITGIALIERDGYYVSRGELQRMLLISHKGSFATLVIGSVNPQK